MHHVVARRAALSLVVALGLGGFLLPVGGGTAQAAISEEVVYRRIVTPVQGAFGYHNDWGAARGGGTRQHVGNDLMGSKLQPLLAARDGVVSWTRTDGNNMLSIRDEDGWTYTYIHVNNDSPGTDDGANAAEWMFFPGISRGTRVKAGQPVAYMGDSGNAETTAPHLHFEVKKPDGTHVNPYWSLMLSQGRRVHDRCGFDDNPVGTPTATSALGYWATTSDGGVYAYGGAPFHGSMSGKPLAKPVIGLTPTPTGAGYWQLSSDGGIFSFGDAAFHGSTGAMRLNAPIVGMASTPTGRGYWLVATDGGIFSFGDAVFRGSTGAIRLNKPIVGMAPTKTGRGYWLVASDGGIFSFGDARFHGSTGGSTPSPVVDVAPTPSGAGYWMLTRSGSVLAFGDAAWAGEAARIGYCTTPAAVRLVPTRSGKGYWVQSAQGDTFAFGDAYDFGSVRRSGVSTTPSVDLAAIG
jgi:hypothetical protein